MTHTTFGNDRVASSKPQPTDRLDVWQILVRRKWLVIFGIVVGSGLGYLYYMKQTPIYESTARVLVINEKRAVLPMKGIDPTIGYEDNLVTQSLLIRSPLVVGKAIEDHGLGSLKSLAGQSNPLEAIIGGITVISAKGSEGHGSAHVLELKYTGTDPQDCSQVLSAVIDSYRLFLGETAQNISKETLTLITDAKDSLLLQLREKEAAYQKFRREAPLLWNREKGTNIHQERLIQIEAVRAELLLASTQTQARLQAVENAISRGANREAMRLMVERIAGSAGVEGTQNTSLTSQLFPLLLEEQMLLANHGADHPSVKAIRKRIELTRHYVQSIAPQESTEDGRTNSQDFLAVYLESLRQELKANKARQNELDCLFEKEREAAKAMANYEVKDETYRNDIARTQQLFEGVVKRLEEVNLIRDYGGYKTQVISPSGLGVKIKPRFERIMPIACALGVLAGLALGYMVELADKSFRSPEEIAGLLGLPIIGHIPFMTPNKKASGAKQTKLDSALCTFHQPKSRLSEAYRTVRTSLYFSTRGDGDQVIQVSSPDQGDGKSTLASNLAISMAQSGKKVLLVDADFRRPMIHKLFGLDTQVGMPMVIQGQATLPEATRSTEIENLWCIPVGPIPHNPSELLTSLRFRELLETLRNKYDFVLVDTPPLLAVTDPSAVAARVDGVLLAIRISKKSRPNALRATQILNTLGANVLGIVVNGVGNDRGYGYGSTAYGGYRYRYAAHGYGYGYGYGAKENGLYYADEASRTPAPKKRLLRS